MISRRIFNSSRMMPGVPKHDRDHKCPWPRCPIVVSARLWGCRAHWFALPAPIRKRIFAARHPWSIESEDTPSYEYRAALTAAAHWIEAYVAHDEATHK